MAVGYDSAGESFLIRNSWGADRGKRSYFTVTYAYLADRNLSDDFWTIRASEEDDKRSASTKR
jgi:C1A family cysteine protease